jgi:threonine synthase
MNAQQKYNFECVKTKKVLTESGEEIINCPHCNGPITIKMNIERLKEKNSHDLFFKKKINSMWSFFDFLPLHEKSNIISLKEGNTAVVKSNRLAKELGFKNLFLKFEFLNPTGSFKDRQISMGMSKAVEMNKKSVITMSSGNVGASVAAYSGRAGVKNIILVPSIAPESKILQIKAYGGNVIKINSDSTEFISQIVKEASFKFNMANLITAAIYNPFIINGAKTISYEIAIKCMMESLDFPDVIIIPVGGSGLLSAVYEGFKELLELDLIHSMPKLIGVQPEGCAPFVQAIIQNLEPEYLFKNPWKNIHTISTALADDIPLDCYTGIPAVKNSKGFAISVSDDETLIACKQLGQLEGVFAEPSSCTTIAALSKLKSDGILKRDDNVLCLITGSGFKDVKSIESNLSESLNVEKDFDWRAVFKRILSS